LDASIFEKSMGGGDLLCSGKSPSSMSSSFCHKWKHVNEKHWRKKISF